MNLVLKVKQQFLNSCYYGSIMMFYFMVTLSALFFVNSAFSFERITSMFVFFILKQYTVSLWILLLKVCKTNICASITRCDEIVIFQAFSPFLMKHTVHILFSFTVFLVSWKETTICNFHPYFQSYGVVNCIV